MTTKALKVHKEDGRVQRSDYTLTKEVASSLVQLIFIGQNLFSGEDKDLTLYIEGKEKKITKYALNNWIRRRDVIMGTKKVLKDLLDEAKIQYRTKKREEKQDFMINEAETKLHRAVRVRTKSIVISKQGKIVLNDKGEPLMKEDAGLLAAQISASKFILERLDPKNYGAVERGEHKHVHTFVSLAELRKAREDRSSREVPNNQE